MARKAFAWKFHCDKALDQIVSHLNGAGPWEWQGRESYWYGDYLNCRPAEGVRVRIHDHGEPTPPQFERSELDYTMQLDISTESGVETSSFISLAKELLTKIGAANIVEIDPYDSALWKPRRKEV